MKITEEEVRYVAALANLALTDEETRRFAADLSGILTHAEALNEVDTSGVEPMAQVLYDAGETATLRDDVEGECLDREVAMQNAPLHGAGYFKVPRVIER